MIIETKEKFKIKSKNGFYYRNSECNHSRIYPCGLQCDYSLNKEIISVGARYETDVLYCSTLLGFLVEALNGRILYCDKKYVDSYEQL